MRHKSESRAKVLLGVAPDPVICDAIHHVDLLRWLAGRSRGSGPIEARALDWIPACGAREWGNKRQTLYKAA